MAKTNGQNSFIIPIVTTVCKCASGRSLTPKPRTKGCRSQIFQGGNTLSCKFKLVRFQAENTAFIHVFSGGSIEFERR